jgi:hypothetical protein
MKGNKIIKKYHYYQRNILVRALQGECIELESIFAATKIIPRKLFDS